MAHSVFHSHILGWYVLVTRIWGQKPACGSPNKPSPATYTKNQAEKGNGEKQEKNFNPYGFLGKQSEIQYLNPVFGVLTGEF